MDPVPLLAKLIRREDLTLPEARGLFDALMDDHLDPVMTAALLAALASKGETVDELVGAAGAMRSRMTPVRVPADATAIDTCGTGGDGKPIFNVSTCVAIVAAAAGATVAKHGNRSNARPSGSAEVAGALGVNLDADVSVLERCLDRCRIAFLYAVRLHPAMKHAAAVRRALGVRTIFNLVGPLTNPAGVRRQMIGVHRPELVPTMIATLRQLGADRVMVVHGREGLCDLSTAGASFVGRWDGQRAHYEELDCRVIGTEPGPLTELHVNGPDQSAAVIRDVLDGGTGLAREIVVFNTAAALWVAALAADWGEGAERARQAIDNGAARRTLSAWVAESRR